MDCDDGCPAGEGPEILRRAAQIRPDIQIGVVLAHREFEAWFIAAIESLRGKHNIAAEAACPADPESIRGAKEWLGGVMMSELRYSPTTDQPALTALFDIQAARRKARSFDKCFREIVRLLGFADRLRNSQ